MRNQDKVIRYLRVVYPRYDVRVFPVVTMGTYM